MGDSRERRRHERWRERGELGRLMVQFPGSTVLRKIFVRKRKMWESLLSGGNWEEKELGGSG